MNGNHTIKLVVKDKSYQPAFLILSILFLLLSAIWIVLQITGHTGDKVAHAFGGTYGLVALVGGLFGLYASRTWGGFKSYFGKAIIFLSLGLLLQEFGQLAFTYQYIIQGIEVPYPSIADLGFFGAVPMYITGAFFLMKGLGIGAVVRKSPAKLLLGVFVPLVVLAICYWAFLKGYDATGLGALIVLLDFGYPLGQAVYVSIALVTLLSVGRYLGGVMKKPVLLLLLAFMAQYAADFNFLWQAHHGTWVNGAYGDYLYFFAYSIMAMSLVALSGGLAKGFTKSLSEEEAK